MKDLDYWNLFCETGRIDAYLQYSCTSEESQLHRSQDREGKDAGERDRDGAFGISHW